jgi:hypothetical protein
VVAPSRAGQRQPRRGKGSSLTPRPPALLRAFAIQFLVPQRRIHRPSHTWSHILSKHTNSARIWEMPSDTGSVRRRFFIAKCDLAHTDEHSKAPRMLGLAAFANI